MRYDAELHIVHKRIDNGTTGDEYAVIGILLDASKDITSGLIDRLNLTNLRLGADGLLPTVEQ